jgi:hypothetical protein
MSMWWDYVSEVWPQRPRPIVLSPDNIWVWSLVDWYWQRKAEETRGKPVPVSVVHHKSHMDWPGREPGPPLWQVGDQTSKPWHGLWTGLWTLEFHERWCFEQLSDNQLSKWAYSVELLNNTIIYLNEAEKFTLIMQVASRFFFRNVVCLLAMYCCIYKALLYVLFYKTAPPPPESWNLG